jgi:membrane fusion protein (multidrug efflux system)
MLVSGGYYWRFVAPYESTDDAFVEADVTPIAPQVAGRVLMVPVSDNQLVEKGAVLFEIDPSDYQAQLDQARAELTAARGRAAQADAQLAVDRAKVAQEHASVTAAEAEANRAEADYGRYRDVGSLAVSASQVDLAATQARSSAAQVTEARNRQLAMEAQTGLDEAEIQTARAEVIRGEASVRQAELNLSYTRVVAPVEGFVTHRGVEPGDYAQAGQPQLALVPRNVWVVANFKETQLTRMRPGQPVEISVDAYPQLIIRGHVDSIQSGAGARFSLFPPENASGNYVKVVQRVPVKIVLDDAQGAQVLGPGMSVIPEVRVR